MFTRSPVVSMADAIRHLRTEPRCLDCRRVLTSREAEAWTSFCDDHVPALLIRFEPPPQEERRSG